MQNCNAGDVRVCGYQCLYDVQNLQNIGNETYIRIPCESKFLSREALTVTCKLPFLIFSFMAKS